MALNEGDLDFSKKKEKKKKTVISSSVRQDNIQFPKGRADTFIQRSKASFKIALKYVRQTTVRSCEGSSLFHLPPNVPEIQYHQPDHRNVPSD